MDDVKLLGPGAFFDRTGTEPLITLPFSVAANANYQVAMATGLLPARGAETEYSAVEIVEIRAAIWATPMTKMLDAMDAFDPAARAGLTRAIEDGIFRLTGNPAGVPEGGLPFMWRNSSCYGFAKDERSGEDAMLFTVRSNRTLTAAGKVMPLGAGFTQVDENGIAENAKACAAREMLEEVGLAAPKIVDHGYGRRSTALDAFPIPLRQGGVVPGIVATVSYYGVCAFDESCRAVQRRMTLNDETFGSFALRLGDLCALAENKAVEAEFIPANTEATSNFLSGAVGLAQSSNRQLSLSAMQAHALDIGIMKPEFCNQRGTLDFAAAKPVFLTREDFAIGPRNVLAVALEMFERRTGQALPLAAASFVKAHSPIDMPSGSVLASLPREGTNAATIQLA